MKTKIFTFILGLFIYLNSFGYNNPQFINYSNSKSCRALAVEQNFIWAGTHGGVLKLDLSGNILEKFTSDNGLAENYVYSVVVDKQGNKWFGTWSSGISKYDGFKFTTYNSKNGLPNNRINALAVDPQGNIWAGTNAGVSRFDGNNWTTFNSKDGLANNRVHAIAFDNQGNAWFGTFAGVSMFDGSKWTTYNKSNGLVNNGVRSIMIDAAGNKWFGTGKGVTKFDNVSFTNVNYSNGLANNQVLSMAIDSKGTKWIGTHSGGISKFRDTDISTLNTAKGLNNDFVHAVVVDSEGNTWIGTENGVSKITQDGDDILNETQIVAFSDISRLNENSIVALKQENKLFNNANERKQNVENSDYALTQNFPNPFENSTFIRYRLSETSKVNLSVLDLSGKELSNLVNQTQTAGDYQVEFNRGNLISGVYYYKFVAGKFVKMKRMTIY